MPVCENKSQVLKTFKRIGVVGVKHTRRQKSESYGSVGYIPI
jgi:hypothetical protein